MGPRRRPRRTELSGCVLVLHEQTDRLPRDLELFLIGDATDPLRRGPAPRTDRINPETDGCCHVVLLATVPLQRLRHAIAFRLRRNSDWTSRDSPTVNLEASAMTQHKVLLVPGSLRSGSHTTRSAARDGAVGAVPLRLRVLRPGPPLPHYDADYDGEGSLAHRRLHENRARVPPVQSSSRRRSTTARFPAG